MRRSLLSVIILSLLVSYSYAQISQENVQNHVYFLADDSLEGRLTGSEGERIAHDYIINRFKEIGISTTPGVEEFLHEFSYRSGKEYGSENSLIIGEVEYSLDEDFYPLAYSGNRSISGSSIYLNHGMPKDYSAPVEGKIIIIESSIPDTIDPHSETFDKATLRNRVKMAAEKNAIGVVVINLNSNEESPVKNYEANITPFELPVIFLKNHVSKELNFKEELDLSMATDLLQKYGDGKNVLGHIDNPSDKSIVIGAHYDHLGWGIPGSRYFGDEPMIHNGADDNASGVSLMIDIARVLASKDLNYDIHFVAFSGEELGLYGSKSMFEDEILDKANINYMINMDMVGRLDHTEREIAISGVGTSPSWESTLDNSNTSSLSLKTKKSGNGPSDHASFYFNDIPVLHFFTGTHEDYHHPNDDADKLNYSGMVEIGNLILSLISELDSQDQLVFTKTKDESIKAPKFTVTLGVMPDYMFEGSGMKIFGVTEGKLADDVGLLKDDVVVKMGDHDISDMMSYMEGLAMFRKGQSTTIRILRGKKLIDYEITFK